MDTHQKDKPRRPMTDANAGAARTVAITGASTGLGRDIALGFAAMGYRVFGTALRAEGVTNMRDASDGKVVLAVCDITREDEVEQWVKSVSSELGDGGLDVLISNAGTLTPGPMELIPLTAVRHEFDVNVFGAIKVINAFLPALRKAQGRIVQVGAVTGRLPLPFDGPSSASKAALEALADVYRLELKPFGISFVIAQAGNMRTGGPAKTAAALERMAEAMSAEQRELYGARFGSFAGALNQFQNSGLDSDVAAQQIIALADQAPAAPRVPVGSDAVGLLKLASESSDVELDAMRLQLLGLE
jgi:NAD(P)-dependent dehydrogenase (short-subunit alcohol dehydrogenase family)